MLRSVSQSSLLLALPLFLLLPIAAVASDLAVSNAWATIPEPYENSSAYFVIQNKGGKLRTIVAASCPACDWIEIHRAVLKNGMMDSEKLEKMEIPAGGAVAFVPRGLSLNLVGVEKLAVGETVPIELEFADGEKLKIEAVGRED